MEANVNLDVAGVNAGIDIFLNASAEMNQTLQKANQINERLWNRLQSGTPVTKRDAKAGVYPASGNLVISVTKPELGYYLNVESVVIGGTDFNVTAAGSAGLYVFGMNNGTSPGLSNAVDYASSLPNAGFYGFRDITLNAGDHLIVVIFNGTPGQTYVVNVVSTVYNVAAALGDTLNAGA